MRLPFLIFSTLCLLSVSIVHAEKFIVYNEVPLDNNNKLYVINQGEVNFVDFNGVESGLVPLSTDDTVKSNDKPVVKLLAKKGKFIIISDSYTSIPGSSCELGEEVFLRVLSHNENKDLKQEYSTKLKSCNDNINVESDGIHWNSDKGIFTVNWLNGFLGINIGGDTVMYYENHGENTKVQGKPKKD